MKLIKLYNAQTECFNEYILVSQDERNFYCLLPIEYFWLKQIKKIEMAPALAVGYDKITFSCYSSANADKLAQNYYEKRYGRYYKGFVLDDFLLRYLGHISSFVEHYESMPYIRDKMERLDKCIRTWMLDDPEYIQAVGRLITFITGGTINADKENALKGLFMNLHIYFSNFYVII